MTSSLGTLILSRNLPSQEKPEGNRQLVHNAGEFATLIQQAVVKPQAQARGATDQSPRDISPVAKARNLGAEAALKAFAPAKEEDSAAAQIPSWPASFVAQVSQEEPEANRQLVHNAGKFASLIHQAALKPSAPVK